MQKYHKLFCFIPALSLLAALTVGSAAQAGDLKPAIQPLLQPGPRVRRNPWQDDVLLVSVSRDAEKQEIADILKDNHAVVKETIDLDERGQMLVIQLEKGKLAQMEKKFQADKHFSRVQRNFVGSARVRVVQPAQRATNDPYYPEQWQLKRMGGDAFFLDKTLSQRVPNNAQPVFLFVMDSGCSRARLIDAGQKILPGIDVIYGGSGNNDVLGHGTVVQGIAGCQTDNRIGLSAFSCVYTIPVKVLDDEGYCFESDIIKGLQFIRKSVNAGRRCVVNLSFGFDPPYDLGTPIHSEVNYLMATMYATGKAIFFQAQNNVAALDNCPALPYLNKVAGLRQNSTFAPSSGFGPSVTFIAPAEDVLATLDGNVGTVSGNSGAVPLVSSIAAVGWLQKPALTSAQLRNRMIQGCKKVPGIHAYRQGYGVPIAPTIARLCRQ